MDAESRQVEDLKAENARLKEALEELDDHGRALSFVERLVVDNRRDRDLITKLCEEVEWLAAKVNGYDPDRELLRRAREATR